MTIRPHRRGRRQNIPILERWQRDRNRTMRLIGDLAHLVKTAPERDIDRIHWDIEEWEMCLGWAKAALKQRAQDGLTRERITSLREMTEARGCTPAETMRATEAADRLEARLTNPRETRTDD